MPRQPSSFVAGVDHRLCDECGPYLPLRPPTAIELRRDGLPIS